MLQLERDKGAQDRQLETARKSLAEESARRSKLEHALTSRKSELSKLKDHNIKLDRELNKALTDLKNREWEVKQLESKQDKTIVEHVHVLEEAKRVTDRQLLEAQKELAKNAAYIRSLLKAKNDLTGETEDLVRQTERERVELRVKERTAKEQEEKAAKALANVEKERHAKDVAELQARRLQNELNNARRQIEETAHQLSVVQRSKDNLESELERLADETEVPNSMAIAQREYEARITQLEQQLGESDLGRAAAAKLRERVEHQHAEIRRLVMNSGPTDSTFQSRLLQELQQFDDDLEKEFSSRGQSRGGLPNDRHSMANVTPSKRSMGRRSEIKPPSSSSHPSDRQVTALRQHVQVLEIQMAASERVRQHLQSSIREMTAELDNTDGSKQSIQQYRARLSKENARLAELLSEEADARRASEAAQIDGVQAMWSKFQDTISEERLNYERLDESRKALVSNPFTFRGPVAHFTLSSFNNGQRKRIWRTVRPSSVKSLKPNDN